MRYEADGRLDLLRNLASPFQRRSRELPW